MAPPPAWSRTLAQKQLARRRRGLRVTTRPLDRKLVCQNIHLCVLCIRLCKDCPISRTSSRQKCVNTHTLRWLYCYKYSKTGCGLEARSSVGCRGRVGDLSPRRVTDVKRRSRTVADLLTWGVRQPLAGVRQPLAAKCARAPKF